jgi:PAS domain-containing protein
MENETSELFRLASKYFFKKFKESGGSQGQLAKEFGVTQAYLSSVMNGSRSASFDLYNRVANRLYGPLDKYLAVGRNIKEGRDPLAGDKEKSENDGVESLIARLTYYVMDHRRIEKEIHELKQFYESIVENLQSAVLVMDREHKIIYANRYLAKLAGIRPEQVIGVNTFAVEAAIPKLQIREFVEKYKEAAERLSPHFFENLHLETPLSGFNYNSGWLIPLLSEDKSFKGMICTFRDTSYAHALFSLLAQTVEHMPDGVVILQQKAVGEVPSATFANKKFRKILGLEDADPFAFPFMDLVKEAKKYVTNFKEWEKFVKYNIKTNVINAKFIIELKSGNTYQVTGNPLTDQYGLHIGRIATLMEIKSKRAENGRS